MAKPNLPAPFAGEVSRRRSDILRMPEVLVQQALRVFLPLWFIAMNVWHLVELQGLQLFALDARIYRGAASAWLSGGDPWAVSVGGFSFGALPTTLLIFAPLAMIPEDLAIAATLAISGAAAIWCVIRLGLPLWWVLFPPLVEAVFVGSLQPVVLALLLAGAGGVAVVGKLFAALPLALDLRVRELVHGAGLLLLTAPLLPWTRFVDQFRAISENVRAGAEQMSATIWIAPVLAPPAIAALLLVGRARRSWLSVPVLWPFPQINYATLALPAMTPGLAFWVAIPARGSATVGLIAWVAIVLLWGRLSMRRGGRAGAVEPSDAGRT